MTLQRLNDEANKKILEQAGKIEMLEMQKIEMRQAFDKVRSGKEKQLKDAHLIFFAKRKEQVGQYNDLTRKFETYKVEMQKELELKDKIIKQWERKHS